MSRADEQVGLTRRLAGCVAEVRRASKVRHRAHELVARRVYQVGAGYEDCNDADDLRHDPVLKAAVPRLPQTGQDLASQPTLSRFENCVGRRQLWQMARVLVETFVGQHACDKPRPITVDFDATDDPTHGRQPLSRFDGYCDEQCYLALIMTAQADDGPQELVVALLRRGRCHASRNALAVLKRLVARFREQWPGVEILMRADSGFAPAAPYDWCEAQATPVHGAFLLGRRCRRAVRRAPGVAVKGSSTLP